MSVQVGESFSARSDIRMFAILVNCTGSNAAVAEYRSTTTFCRSSIPPKTINVNRIILYYNYRTRETRRQWPTEIACTSTRKYRTKYRKQVYYTYVLAHVVVDRAYTSIYVYIPFFDILSIRIGATD